MMKKVLKSVMILMASLTMSLIVPVVSLNLNPVPLY